MSRLTSVDLPLSGLKLVQRHRVSDERGYFSRIFCAKELADFGWKTGIEQINHSFTRLKGSVRGLHFQRNPHCEMKLVSVIRGAIWDVAVDLRAASDTYLECHGELLSADDGGAMLIPEGFAHGFQSLTDDVEILYCHSAPYNSAAEDGLHPLDSSLDIDWPLSISEMSKRDHGHRFIDGSFRGITVL